MACSVKFGYITSFIYMYLQISQIKVFNLLFIALWLMKKEAESFKTFASYLYNILSFLKVVQINLVSQRDRFYQKIALIKVLVQTVGSQTETYCSLKNQASKYVDV